MCSPMPDLPEHYPVPVNSMGEGPVPDEDAHHYECWCGDLGCIEEPARRHL